MVHVLLDVALAALEGCFDDLVDPFLDLVVLLGHNGQHLAVEDVDLLVQHGDGPLHVH